MSEHIETGLEAFAASAQPPANAANAPPSNSLRATPIADLPLVPRKREWLHGTDLMRGAVSMMVAPGARAKTTWLLTCALACASGRSLLDANVYGGALCALYLSAENSRNEIALRLRAAMQHHGLSNTDVPRLYIIGADQWGLPLLNAAAGVPRIDERGWNALIAELDQINPDVLIIDPLINVMGGVDANNNSAAAVLMWRFAGLAAMRRIAVMIAHHAAKGRDPKSAESAMGAATFVNLCKIVLSIEPLDKKDAGQVGLPTWEATSVFRVVGTKQNYRPPDKGDRWFRLRSAEIQNQQPPVYPHGERVAVIEEFQPGSSGATFPLGLIRDALLALDAADPPLSSSPQARTRYAVPIMAQAIAPHRGGRADETEGKNVLDHLLSSDLVRVEDVKLSRAGGRSDTRNGLVLTPAGKEVVQKENVVQEQNEVTSNSPQSPQSPAV